MRRSTFPASWRTIFHMHGTCIPTLYPDHLLDVAGIPPNLNAASLNVASRASLRFSASVSTESLSTLALVFSSCPSTDDCEEAAVEIEGPMPEAWSLFLFMSPVHSDSTCVVRG